MPAPAKSSTTTRVNKRLAQGAKSRQEILDAASQLMSSRGFAATSVADIARDSGLPNSSIYWHFNSKAGILAAVMERGAERFFEDVKPRLAEADESPRDHLQRSFENIGETFLAHPEFLRLYVLLLLGDNSTEVTDIVKRVREQGRHSLLLQISASLTPWGEQIAGAISERIVDFALAGFDGAFLGAQTGAPGLYKRLMSQLAESLYKLAEDERAALPDA